MKKIVLKKSPEEYCEIAKGLFLEGYNCSQSVVLTFADELGLPKEIAAKLASSFGGGMGRLREVCGTVSGMFIVAGLISGYSEPKDYEGKKEHYKRIQELAQKFKESEGSIICRELLGLKKSGADSFVPEKRTDEYYKKRPCKDLAGLSAKIVSEYFLENK